MVKDQDNSLVICALDYKRHAGEFECTASNSLGTVSERMVLTITGKPDLFVFD